MKTKILLFVALLSSVVTFSQKKWTLKQCVDHALKNNISIQQNTLNVALSKAEIKNAKGNFLPTLGASTNGNLNFGSSFNPVTNNRVNTSIFGGSLGLNTGVTIFNGFRNLNIYKQSELGVKSSELDLKVIQNNISLQVINAYLNVLFTKENLEVSKVQFEISKSQITRLEEQFKEGVVAKSELLNVKSSVSNDAQNLLVSENNLTLALSQLSQLIQVSFEGFDVAKIKTDQVVGALLYKNYKEVYDKALANRPEIERQKLDIEKAKLNVNIAKSGYLPTVTASGSVGTNYGYNLDSSYRGNNIKFGTQLDNNLGYGVGFNVNIPIFNGFKNDVAVQKAKISQNISESQLENQKLQLEQTIQQAFLDAKLALKSYETAQESVEAQKEAFKNAEISYKYGKITLFDFDQVRNRLTSSEGVLIRAKYDYVFKTKVLKFYFGEDILE